MWLVSVCDDGVRGITAAKDMSSSEYMDGYQAFCQYAWQALVDFFVLLPVYSCKERKEAYENILC